MRIESLMFLVIFIFFNVSTFASPFEVGLSYYKKNECLDKFGFPSKNKDGYLAEECAPDTLYRWGLLLETRNKLYKPLEWKTILNEPIFMAFSPLSTYPYHKTPYRFKVKKGVKFKIIYDSDYDKLLKNIYSLCQDFPKKELENIIWVRGSKTTPNNYQKDWIFWEYDTCTLDVFESISLYQKKAYNEMILERDYIDNLVQNKKLNGNLISYIHLLDGTPLPYMPKETPQGVPVLGVDGFIWNKDVLTLRLSEMKRAINSPKVQAKLWIHPDFKHLGYRNILRRHFLTNRPTYWNWNKI